MQLNETLQTYLADPLYLVVLLLYVSGVVGIIYSLMRIARAAAEKDRSTLRGLWKSLLISLLLLLLRPGYQSYRKNSDYFYRSAARYEKQLFPETGIPDHSILSAWAEKEGYHWIDDSKDSGTFSLLPAASDTASVQLHIYGNELSDTLTAVTLISELKKSSMDYSIAFTFFSDDDDQAEEITASDRAVSSEHRLLLWNPEFLRQPDSSDTPYGAIGTADGYGTSLSAALTRSVRRERRQEPFLVKSETILGRTEIKASDFEAVLQCQRREAGSKDSHLKKRSSRDRKQTAKTAAGEAAILYHTVLLLSKES